MDRGNAIFVLNKAQKQKLVEELTNRFKRQKIAIFSDFRGISVSKMQALRRLLKKAGAEYKVAKKTFLDRALGSIGVDIKTRDLEGEIGVVFGYEEEALPAKNLLKFSKENDTFKILGGMLGGRILNSQEVLTLAKLPLREVLISQLLGALQSPMRGLVTALEGNIKNLVIVLQKLKEDKSL